MDLDLAFVAALVTEGKSAFRTIIERGIEPKHLVGDGFKAYEFVLDYYKSYSALPTAEIVEGKTGVHLEPVQGSVLFFAEEVLNRRLQATLLPKVKEWVGFIEEAKPRQLVEHVTATLRDVRKEFSTTHVELLPRLGGDVWEDYKRMKGGAWGIEIPWPSLNERTLGMWPEDLIIFAARSGVGKSWVAIMLARHAWLNNRRVLLVTTEMSRINVTRRFLAIHMKLPYNAFRRGLLGSNVEPEIEKQIQDIANADGLYIVGGDFNFTFDGLETAIDEAEPDLLIVDGAYLLASTGNSRTEKAAGIFDELKRIAKRHRVPLVATSQFNRDVKPDTKGGDVALDRLALTDVAAWNADVVVALNRTKDMKHDNKVEFHVLKNREGILGDPFLAWWNFESMTFDEIPSKGGGDSDEFGTGMPQDLPPPPSADDGSFAPF